MAGFNPLNQIVIAIKELASEIYNLVSRLDNLVSRFNNLDSRFNNFVSQFNNLDSQFNNIDSRFNNLDSRLDNIDSRLDNIDSRLDNIDSRLDNIDSEVRELRAIVTTNQMLIKSNTALLNELVHEVSRFTGKSDNLMISAFAYATRHCKAIHTGDIAKFGKMATDVSIVEGFSYERMDDPRYGNVYVYEQEALNIAFEYFFIRKQTTYTGDN